MTVLFQLQLLADFLLACAAENQPRRFCRPVDAALGKQQLAFSFEEAKFEAAGAGVTNQNLRICQHDECRPTIGLPAQTGCVRNPTHSRWRYSEENIYRMRHQAPASERRIPAG